MLARLHSLFLHSHHGCEGIGFIYIRNVEIGSGGRGVVASFLILGEKRTEYLEFAVSKFAVSRFVCNLLNK